ncbi:MAG: PKD domain-containing protein [Bacteroidetes bacterium]|nr:PKD domain-containing protein [Bacteroidota bacterium]
MGDYSIFQDSSFTASGYLKSWYWDFGDDWGQSTSTEKNPSYKYHEVGDYVVSLTVENTYGCVDSVKKIASVKALPVADFTFDRVCKGSPTHFWDLSNPVDGNIVYWYWNFGDTLTMLDTAKRRNPYYKYNKLGIHTVELLVANEFGCKDEIQKDVEVHPIPRSIFRVIPNFQNHQGDIMVEDESIGASGYQWDWGDGGITFGNDRPILHAYDEDGKYIIQLIVWNEFDCMDTSYHEYQFMFKALYVPNALSPTSQNEQVRIFKPKGIGLKMYTCEIFDTWGNRLWMSTLLDRDGRPVEGWDGYYNGKLLPQDVYVWRIKAVFRDGSIWEGESMGNTEDLPQEKYGTVTLIK